MEDVLPVKRQVQGEIWVSGSYEQIKPKPERADRHVQKITEIRQESCIRRQSKLRVTRVQIQPPLIQKPCPKQACAQASPRTQRKTLRKEPPHREKRYLQAFQQSSVLALPRRQAALLAIPGQQKTHHFTRPARSFELMFPSKKKLQKYQVPQVDLAPPKRQGKHRVQLQRCVQENAHEKPQD